MKKIYKYISLVALTALSAGCAKELVNPEDLLTNSNNQELINGEFTVQLSVPESAQTKTVLGTKDGSTYPIYWSPEDVITLNGTAASEFTPSVDFKSATAKFNVKGLAAPYNFLYCGVSGTGNQVSFPATQNYVSGGFDPAAMPMYASLASRQEKVTFAHVGSLLKFSFTGTSFISSVSLRAVDKTKSLSGSFTIGTTNGVLNGTLAPNAADGRIFYDFNEDQQLSETPFSFYVAIPAGTYPGGIIVDVRDSNSDFMTLKIMDSSESETIAAGRVREFETLEYSPIQDIYNSIKIYDEATLQTFVNRVVAGEQTLKASVTEDFNVTKEIEGLPLEDYIGTFEGNNNTITGLTQPLFNVLKGSVRNLTLNSNITGTDADDRNWGIFAKVLSPSSEEAGLQNCTAKGTLTYTPSSALSAICQIGGLVGNNNGGAVTNCNNEATVTMGNSGETHSSQVSIGGVVGRTQKGGDLSTQGDISNCTNNGTVVCNAQLSENVYIGGVLGYQVEKAEYISGCVNHGHVKLGSTFSTTKAIQLGGVIGLGKGIIEKCTNGTDGVVTSESGCTGGTYICQGGVVGRLNNDSGQTYSGLTNAGNINAAAAGAASGTYIGGMVGRCDESASLSNCTNTGGTLEYSGVNSTSPLHVGGIVGQSEAEVSSCTNATAVIVSGEYTLNSSGKYLSIGGIVGRQAIYSEKDENNNTIDTEYELINNTNTAAVTFSGYATGYTALGGVVGYCDCPISGGGNSGTVSFIGYNNDQNIPIGGIVARTPKDKEGDRITGVTNSGTIVINAPSQTKKEFYIGGVVGHPQSGDISATNTGKVEVVKFKCTTLYLGGVAGYNLDGNLSATNSGDMQIASLNCSYNFMAGGVAGRANGEITATNNGNIELAEVSVTSDGKNIYVGGVIGEHDSGSLTATNNGSLTISDACSVAKGDILAGGVVGNAQAPLRGCTNTGTVSNGGSISKKDTYLDIGGVVGYNNGNAPLTNCRNTGDVINTGNASSGYLCVGGVSGETSQEITESSNTGNVSNSGVSGNSRPTSVGGIVGTGYSYNLTSCYSKDGKISNTSASKGVRVGGIIGYWDKTEHTLATNCVNESEIYIFNEVEVNTDDQVSVGGITGKGAHITFTSCENKGYIKVEMDGSTNLGGVKAGGIFGDNKVSNQNVNDCYNCINSNDIDTYYRYTGGYPSIQPYAVGGIAGRVYPANEDGETTGTIKNCTNSGYLYSEANQSVLGGIVAQLEEGQILNCTNTNTVHQRYNKSMKTNIPVGGIVGNAWGKATLISGCKNSGSVIAKTNPSNMRIGNYIGGIIGWVEENCEVSDCENTGSVTSNPCADKAEDAACAGGIIGLKQSVTTDKNNINRGNVTAMCVKNRAAAAGGIIGIMQYGTIEACYNYGNIEAGEKSSQWGDAIGTYNKGVAGSLVGYYKKEENTPYYTCEGTITKCYVGGTVQGKHTNGEVVTITADNFGGNIVGWGVDPTDCFFAGNAQ